MTSAEGMKAAKEAEAMGIDPSYHSMKSRPENQLELMYGNKQKKKNNQSFPNSGWKNTLCDAYIFHKLDYKQDTVKDRHCRAICTREGRGGGKQVKMNSKIPDLLHWA